MCYLKVHTCKYCKVLYPCILPNLFCPTANDDVDANLCDSDRKKLEEELEKLDFDSLKDVRISDIIGDNDD